MHYDLLNNLLNVAKLVRDPLYKNSFFMAATSTAPSTLGAVSFSG